MVLDEARARVTNLETEILSLKEYFAKEKQLPAQKALRNEEKPAFTVALSVDEDVTDDYIIVFDDVITDVQGNYDTSFGFFQCTITGFYLFAVTIAAPEGRSPSAYLEMSTGTRLMDIHTYNTGLGSTGSHTNSAVVYCAAGQSVYVRAVSEGFFRGNGFEVCMKMPPKASNLEKRKKRMSTAAGGEDARFDLDISVEEDESHVEGIPESEYGEKP